ncbi:YHS domain-containing (seleno)protein [Shewanella intestini]|uniref:YHS domain-containing protein n=1 Tax=Shewanella intestini TaxID=2017544 RepID=A0ABS5I2L2_9GAMM|nr:MULTISPECIES: YHS domain-containing (seleno)protein [Shewanella]MBR9728058.1 YHS domain-containing protein [Shewanella intestini]MRG36530.1 YHS domain-containing protein [Shewanella sp. XMDDZSB0408]
MKKLALGLFALILMGCTSIDKQPVYNDAGNAIEGYDVVAYFSDNQAKKGLAQFSSDYKGAKWLFSSKAHKALFDTNPEQYMPQYGGYCAYAMSSGFVVSVDPQAFTVYQDKLYLNYSLSVRKNWLKRKQQYIKEADAHWLDKINSQ